jgi:hypothetical protein
VLHDRKTMPQPVATTLPQAQIEQQLPATEGDIQGLALGFGNEQILLPKEPSADTISQCNSPAISLHGAAHGGRQFSTKQGVGQNEAEVENPQQTQMAGLYGD